MRLEILDEFKSSFPGSLTLTKKESYELLADIQSEIKFNRDADILDVIQELSEEGYASNKKLSNILSNMLIDISTNGSKIADVFLEYRLIYQDEYILISHSKDLVQAISNIRNLRKNGKRFEKWVVSFFIMPLLILLIGLLINIPLASFFVDTFVNDLIPKLTKGKPYIQEIHLLFFLENLLWTKLFVFIYIGAISSVIGAYYYLDAKNTGLLYKYLPTKFYDDFYYYLKIMDIVFKADGGIPVDDVFKMLGQNVESEYLRAFFMKTAEERINYYINFEDINAPGASVKKIKHLEEYDLIRKQLSYIEKGEEEGLLIYFKQKRDDKLESLDLWLKRPLAMLVYVATFMYIAITVGSLIAVVSKVV